MATRIRLKRKGRRKQSHFSIVVMHKGKPRDADSIDQLGYYNPLKEPSEIKIDKEKALEWLQKGAQPSDTVHNLFQKEGIALEYHLLKNDVDEETRNVELQKWELAQKENVQKTSEEISSEDEEVEVESTSETTESNTKDDSSSESEQEENNQSEDEETDTSDNN